MSCSEGKERLQHSMRSALDLKDVRAVTEQDKNAIFDVSILSRTFKFHSWWEGEEAACGCLVN